MKLEIKNKRKTRKFTKLYKLNNTLLNNQKIKEEIKSKFRNYLEMNENKTTTYLHMGCSKSSAKEEIYSYKCLY